MTTRQPNNALGLLVRAAVTSMDADANDGELLHRFIERRDEGAFEALVRRHGPMVLGVCRRVLPNEPDAEDAFQAAFLILALKAASISPREMLANWLHGVARRVASRARRAATRRAARERQVSVMPEPEAVSGADGWGDVAPVLDRELSRLPDRYRVVVVLCDLEGSTRREAARRLGLPEGTINSRLSRARALLAKRLTRHGVVLSAGTLAAVLSRNASACVPASVAGSTVRVSLLTANGDAVTTGAIAANVAALTHGVGQAMIATKLKLMTVVVVMLGALGVTFGLAAGQTQGNGPDSRPGRVASVDGTVAAAPAPVTGGRGAKSEAPEDRDWHPLAKGRLVAVHVERCLYEVKGEKLFLMAVRVTNLTDAEIGVDLRGERPGVYPNQWCVQDAEQRFVIDEERATHAAPDPAVVRADFKAARLTALPAGKSTVVYTEFNNGGRAEVDRCKGKYFIVSMDGQIVATDGTVVEVAFCAWTDGVDAARTDVVLPFPVTWKVAGGAVNAEGPPTKPGRDEKPDLVRGVVKEVSGDGLLLSGGERVTLTPATQYLRETGLEAAPAELSDVTKGTSVSAGGTKEANKFVAHAVVIELIQPKPKGEGDKGKPAEDPRPASDDVRVQAEGRLAAAPAGGEVLAELRCSSSLNARTFLLVCHTDRAERLREKAKALDGKAVAVSGVLTRALKPGARGHAPSSAEDWADAIRVESLEPAEAAPKK